MKMWQREEEAESSSAHIFIDCLSQEQMIKGISIWGDVNIHRWWEMNQVQEVWTHSDGSALYLDMLASISIQETVPGYESQSDTSVSMTASHLHIIKRKKANKGLIAVDGCCRPASAWEELYKVFYKQLEEALWWQALVPIGKSIHHDICWKGNARRHKQSQR